MSCTKKDGRTVRLTIKLPDPKFKSVGGASHRTMSEYEKIILSAVMSDYGASPYHDIMSYWLDHRNGWTGALSWDAYVAINDHIVGRYGS